MPYRRAHWYLLALLPLTALAFWKQFLTQLTAVPVQIHAHAATGTLWMLLLIAQSWTIHHDEKSVHRTVGTASLMLFPLFIASAMAVSILEARDFVASPDHLLAARFLLFDVVAVGGFAYAYFEALRQRRKVHVHARYMLSTVFFLMPAILPRAANRWLPLSSFIPVSVLKGLYVVDASIVVTAFLAFALAIRSGKHGWPFYVAGALLLLSELLFRFVGGMAWWRSSIPVIANSPMIQSVLIAGLLGAFIGYAGWIAGRRPALPSAAVPV